MLGAEGQEALHQPTGLLTSPECVSRACKSCVCKNMLVFVPSFRKPHKRDLGVSKGAPLCRILPNCSRQDHSSRGRLRHKSARFDSYAFIYNSQRTASWKVTMKSFNKIRRMVPIRTSDVLLTGALCASASSLLDVSATDLDFVSASMNSGPM